MNPIDQLYLWDGDYLGQPCPIENPENEGPLPDNNAVPNEIQPKVAGSKESATGVRYLQESLYKSFTEKVAEVAELNGIERIDDAAEEDNGMGLAPGFCGVPTEAIPPNLVESATFLQVVESKDERGSGLEKIVRYQSATSATSGSVGGNVVDKVFQAGKLGAGEPTTGQIHHEAPLGRGVREGDAEFLAVLSPDFKPDFEFRPGDILPPWAADVLSSWPDLADCWWENEGFLLAAAGCGRTEKPKKSGAPLADPRLRDWEAIAAQIIDGDIKVRNSSYFEALEIGIRALPGSRICARAAKLIDETRESRKKKP